MKRDKQEQKIQRAYDMRQLTTQELRDGFDMIRTHRRIERIADGTVYREAENARAWFGM
jgi:hypothetical protein